jgi:hypothetical protein
MKKITLLAVMMAFSVLTSQAQCNDDVPLPYHENFDTAIVPDLPECTYSNKLTFVDGDWETVTAPNNNFTGNVARFITNTDAGWNMYCIYGMRGVQLTAGMAYQISYKYAHDSNDTTIDFLKMGLYRTNANPNIELISHEGISGTEVVSYTSELFTVPVTEIYYPHFDIMSTGSQGILYLDDIKIEEMGVMGTVDNTISGLSCYPNPVKDILTITNAAAIEKLELYNIAGQLLLTQSASEQTAYLNLENLPAGAYFLKAKSGAAAQTLQVIKQ